MVREITRHGSSFFLELIHQVSLVPSLNVALRGLMAQRVETGFYGLQVESWSARGFRGGSGARSPSQPNMINKVVAWNLVAGWGFLAGYYFS